MFLKEYSTPSSYNKSGKIADYKDVDFVLDIGANKVKANISSYAISIGSLRIHFFGQDISTSYDKVLDDIDFNILKSARVNVDSSLKGKHFEYSKFSSPIATRKLINYVFDELEKQGFHPLDDKKDWFLESLCKISKALTFTKNQT